MRSKSFLEIDMSVTNTTVDAKVILKEVSCDGIEIDVFLKLVHLNNVLSLKKIVN